jgi:hypothetical protein
MIYSADKIKTLMFMHVGPLILQNQYQFSTLWRRHGAAQVVLVHPRQRSPEEIEASVIDNAGCQVAQVLNPEPGWIGQGGLDFAICCPALCSATSAPAEDFPAGLFLAPVMHRRPSNR